MLKFFQDIKRTNVSAILSIKFKSWKNYLLRIQADDTLQVRSIPTESKKKYYLNLT